MKNCFSTKFAALAAVFLISSTAFAHNAGEVGTATVGHLRTTNNHPVKNSAGECIHLGAIAPAADCQVKPAAPAAAAPAAAPTPAPAPAPVAKPAPAPVKQKVSFEADALFDFNKATLKADGKKAIDDALAARSKQNLSIDSVQAIGHTDSVGTDAYNDKLSLRRAQAVKDYLVTKNIAASKITVEGKGKRNPEASNKTKEGRAKNRRVDVEFSGVETTTK